ncbi:hypothetical protein ACRALDRAFT_1070081 [Sodiomyces alcalophilus JCM 7366]|uniref:uncharacterized protein n=1 Tax=Sodiomyces alcalophilus JCM 7366 TaxID=591952 RepID=UPI0039B65775
MRFLFLIFAGLVAANFQEHCWNIAINTDRWIYPILEMVCRDPRLNDIWYNKLDLNKCISNVDASLKWDEDGKFSHSVFQLSLDEHGPGIDLSNVHLNGNCRKDSGDPLWPPTWWGCSINLSEKVELDRGQVSCLGHKADIERPTPEEEAKLRAEIEGAQAAAIAARQDHGSPEEEQEIEDAQLAAIAARQNDGSPEIDPWSCQGSDCIYRHCNKDTFAINSPDYWGAIARFKAICTDPKTKEQFWTELDISQCLENDGGILRPKLDGGFNETCRNHHIRIAEREEGTMIILDSDCLRKEQVFQTRAAFPLSSLVWARNGALGCYDRRAQIKKKLPV